MRRLLLALFQHAPSPLKKRGLTELFRLTSSTFGADVQYKGRLSFRKLLEAYALYTKVEAEKLLESGNDPVEIRRKLYQGAFELGAKQRKRFRVCTIGDAMAVARAIYSAIGIDFHGTDDGEVRVERCYFSSFYSGRVCRLMSSLDSGLLAGLCGGGELLFSQRITEGEDCCRAIFQVHRGEPGSVYGGERDFSNLKQ